MAGKTVRTAVAGPVNLLHKQKSSMYLNPDVVGQSLQMKNGSWIARIGMAQL